jgi:ribonuclease E
VHEESDLVWRSLRDLVDGAVAEIHVDTPEALARALETVRVIEPELAERLRLHAGARPLFHSFGVEPQVDRLYSRRVPLPGGGSLVFDRTEAMVTVDVNSGRGRHESGLEETALQTNREAALEVARQIRLRDLGGVIAVDFIDLREPEHVRDVERLFREQLKRDRARVRAGRMGAFGVWVLTRRRAGGGAGAAQRACPRCGGSGEVVHPAQVALRVFRELMARAAEGRKPLRVRVSPEVAELLHATRGGAFEALQAESGCEVKVDPDPALPEDAWEIAAP